MEKSKETKQKERNTISKRLGLFLASSITLLGLSSALPKDAIAQASNFEKTEDVNQLSPETKENVQIISGMYLGQRELHWFEDNKGKTMNATIDANGTLTINNGIGSVIDVHTDGTISAGMGIRFDDGTVVLIDTPNNSVTI